jgi:UDP-4-amino-4,6-dideoxy-N-acetyl-beta-L-altrosamine N-acetyltransferase
MQLKLVRLKEEHLEQVRLWRMKPEVSEYMYTSPDISSEEQKQWYRDIKNDQTKKHWIIEVDGEWVGLVNLYNIDLINKRAYWAYYLGETSVKGKGIGTQVELNILQYVFDKMGLNKLCCEIFTSNEKVIKLHEKFGSNIEGTLRNHIYKDGKFHDIVTMGMMKSDWGKIKGQFQIEKALIED